MHPPRNKSRRKELGWLRFCGLLVLTLGIFGGVILLISLRLRNEIRQQIVGRDGEILTAVASMLHANAREDVMWEPEEEADLLATVLQTSRLRGVLGVRIFDGDGMFWGSVPYGLAEDLLAPQELDQLRQQQPISRYYPELDLAEEFEFSLLGPSRRPVLKVAVPIHVGKEGNLEGVALYLLDGAEIAEEFSALDRNLGRQAGVAFALGGGIFTLLAVIGFIRLRRTRHALIERSSQLLQANEELVLLAKTSAIGALTSHLIHGLKNPLAGLDQQLKALSAAGSEKGEWKEAASAARRMRELINDITAILREEGQESGYELSVSEVGEIVKSKVSPAAAEAGVILSMTLVSEVKLTAKEGNITALILVNLLQNALEASQPGQEVTARFLHREDRLAFEVLDHGPGLSPQIRDRLFLPGLTTRRGGSGLGLAISQLLARQIGASLVLKATGEAGTVFALELAPPTALRPTGSAGDNAAAALT